MRRGANIAVRDVTLVILVGMIALVILLIPHLNPPGKKQEAEATPPGNVIVEIRWPDNWKTDVDLWVLAPKDSPVGYSNLVGRTFNLLRDDLGSMNDPLGLNYENAYSRGIPIGEYVINLHLFRNAENIYPVPVDVQVSTRMPPGAIKRLLHSKVELRFAGQEITVFRFFLNAAGSLVEDTLHSNYTPLRSRRSGL